MDIVSMNQFIIKQQSCTSIFIDQNHFILTLCLQENSGLVTTEFRKHEKNMEMYLMYLD